MTFRFRAVSLLAASMLTLAACGDDTAKDTDDTTNPPGDDDDDTGDTGDTNVAPKVLTTLEFGAIIGFNADTQQVAPVTIDGQEQTSFLYADLGTANWDGDLNNTAEYCSVIMILDGLEAQDWALADQRWLGIDFNGGAAQDDCEGFDATYFEGDPLYWVVDGVNYAIAMGGDLNPQVEEALENALGAEEMYRYWGGSLEATIDGNPFLGPNDFVYSYGYQVDENMNALIDGNNLVPIDKLDAPQGASVASGFYIFNMLAYWDLTQ